MWAYEVEPSAVDNVDPSEIVLILLLIFVIHISMSNSNPSMTPWHNLSDTA